MIATLVLISAIIVVSSSATVVADRGRVVELIGCAIGVVGMGTLAITAAIGDPVVGVWRVICLAMLMLVSALGGASIVPVMFDLAGAAHRSGRSDVDTPLRGGRAIGVLERIAITATILAGWPEGVAVVLAVKGLARYPEIREQHAGEQFIIGTFGSVLWAVAAAGVGRLIVT